MWYNVNNPICLRERKVDGMIVKRFSDGSYLEYAEGKFDQWCIYMVNEAKNYRRPPLDVDYFGFLKEQAQTYGAGKIYKDFIDFYDQTGKAVEQRVLEFIEHIAVIGYGDKWLDFTKIFTILYMGMLAEENKAFTRLGKRIKRLGMHKLLIENETVSDAANFMRGMGWQQIDAMCKERGF